MLFRIKKKITFNQKLKANSKDPTFQSFRYKTSDFQETLTERKNNDLFNGGIASSHLDPQNWKR